MAEQNSNTVSNLLDTENVAVQSCDDHDVDNRYTCKQTVFSAILICMSIFLVIGVAFFMIGATFLDLQLITDTTIAQVSW